VGRRDAHASNRLSASVFTDVAVGGPPGAMVLDDPWPGGIRQPRVFDFLVDVGPSRREGACNLHDIVIVG
jgi:hypothetical protein